MGVGIVLLILSGVLGVIALISGILSFRQNEVTGELGIFFGGLLIMLTIVLIIVAIKESGEKTEKIVGKGVITTSDDIDYVDGGGVSSDKLTFYLLMKNGDKIIVDKEVWEQTEKEFTYKDAKVEKVEE